ncbi:MAG: M56 family metallopeptidase, partial [Chlorobiales bacterium]|nr:M56 family metallopeptidase [Chlorobiales bacterium]
TAFIFILLLPLTESFIPHFTITMLPNPTQMFPFLNEHQYPGEAGFYSNQLNLTNGSGFLANILPFAWLAGVLFMFGRNVLGMALVGWICHRGDGKFDAKVERVFHETVADFAFSRPVKLIRSDLVTVPMTSGILNPIIILPARADEWSTERIKNVLIHELTHVGRWDVTTRFIAGIVRSIFWFNPLFWIASEAMRNEMENACDEAVLHKGVRASDYALDLVNVAVGVPHRGFLQHSVIRMSGNGKLKKRVKNILDHSAGRAAGNRLMPPVAVIVFSCLLIATTAVNPFKVDKCPHKKIAFKTASHSIDVQEAAWALEKLINGLQQHLSEKKDPCPRSKHASKAG